MNEESEDNSEQKNQADSSPIVKSEQSEDKNL